MASANSSNETARPALPEGDDAKPWPWAYRLLLWVAFAIFAGWYVMERGGRSFWLDEALTSWFTSEGIAECIDRSLKFQNQMPVYFLLVWGLRQITGDGELALRSLSLLAVAGSAAVMFATLARLGFKRDAWVGAWVTAFVMLVDPNLGLNARQYALAVFLSLLSVYFLVCWIETGSKRSLAGYIIATVLTVMCQYLFAAVGALHLAVVLLSGRLSPRLFFKWAASWIAIAALLAPCAWHFLAVSRKAGRLEYATPPTPGDVIFLSTVGSYITPLLVVFAIFAVAAWARDKLAGVRAARVGTAIAWWLLGPFLFWVAYVGFGMSIFLPRYFAWKMPALALLTVCGLRGFYSDRVAAFSLVALLAMSIVMLAGDPNPAPGRWREAVAWAKSQAGEDEPLYLYPGLIESASVEWLDDEGYQPYMSACVTQYGWTNRIVLLPLLHPRSKTLFEERIDRLWQGDQRRILLINDVAMVKLIVQRAANAGYRLESSEQFGNVQGCVFVPRGSPRNE